MFTIRYLPYPTFIPCFVHSYSYFFVVYWSLRTQLARDARDFQTRPINSANPAISEIINKNPNEPKSAVIEAFLCGRCRTIVLVMHALISVFRIACQLAVALKFD